MSREGEVEGLESEGVSIATLVLVVLDPERECVLVLVFNGVPPNDLFGSEVVIAQLAFSEGWV